MEDFEVQAPGFTALTCLPRTDVPPAVASPSRKFRFGLISRQCQGCSCRIYGQPLPFTHASKILEQRLSVVVAIDQKRRFITVADDDVSWPGVLNPLQVVDRMRIIVLYSALNTTSALIATGMSRKVGTKNGWLPF